MKLRYILSFLFVILISGAAFAGAPPPVVGVPVYNLQGSLLTAAAFGIVGLFVIFKKRR
ncbi:MAG: hypothetical protein L7F77_02675 [Candidatus Magnetominusculus sp. LBB02]|nr:hypothetical protein [Candidatus Magnetominusculus sp. LBB02]